MSGPAPLRLEVPAALDGYRIDRAVALVTGVSRAAAAAQVAAGGVLVDGVPETRRSAVLRAGTQLVVNALGPGPAPLAPDPAVSFDVVHADGEVIVVDKPWDLVVHPGAGRRDGTLIGGILARFPDVGTLADDQPERPGVVHRLDRGTSGLVVVARTRAAFASLSAQMAAHRTERRYAALLHGHLEHERGLIDAPVGRSTRRPTLMTVAAAGRDARTAYEVVARYEQPFDSTLVVASLETGRTHQVRVHMAAIGHPVVGDRAYGRAEPGRVLAPGRFFLHAFELGFDHPADGRRVVFRAPLPADLAGLLDDPPNLP